MSLAELKVILDTVLSITKTGRIRTKHHEWNPDSSVRGYSGSGWSKPTRLRVSSVKDREWIERRCIVNELDRCSWDGRTLDQLRRIKAIIEESVNE